MWVLHKLLPVGGNEKGGRGEWRSSHWRIRGYLRESRLQNYMVAKVISRHICLTKVVMATAFFVVFLIAVMVI